MKKKVLFALIALLSCLSTWATDVATFAELKAALEDATTTEVKLTANIAVTDYIRIRKAVTLDLNGKAITVSNTSLEEPFIVRRGGDFTVTDNNTDPINQGMIDASNCMLAIKMTEGGTEGDGATGDPAKLTVEAGTIKGETFGISGNGTRNGTVVTITGGKIIATSETDGCGIYNPQDGTLNINGGYIEGFSSAVEIRSGNLNFSITGGELKAKSLEYTCTPNGNGITTKGAALAIAQHTTKHDIAAEIKGGKFTGARSLSVANPQDNNDTQVQVSVTGGEFNGPVVVNGDMPDGFNSQFISGGTFKESPTDYTAVGFYVEQSDESPYNYNVRAYDWELTQTTFPYNANDQKQGIKEYIHLLPAGSNEAYKVTFKKGSDATGDEADEVKDVGSYFVQVYMGGEENPVEIGTGKLIKITAFQLTLGASTTYKQLGDPDPAPNFGVLYDNAPNDVKLEAANLIFDGLYLHRIQGYNDPENDYAGREIKFFMEMNNAAVKNLDGTTNKNYMIAISSTEAWLIVTKKLIRDGEFRAVVNDDIFTYDGLAKKPTDITLEQDMNFDKRGEADYEADWQLVSGLGSILGTVAENFNIDYANNIAADAYGEPRLQGEDEVFDWMANVEPANRATVILTPKADGNFASQIPLGNEQYMEGAANVTGQFKIKQRNINTATIAEIGEVIFKNDDFTPEPPVTYDNGTEAGLTLVENEDFTYDYDNNKYVGTATVTVEATYEVEETEDPDAEAPHIYTGNWWNKQDATFAINPFEFTLKPVDIKKTVGDTDPNPLTTLEAIPSDNMKDGDSPLQFPVQDVTTLLKEGWTLSRAKGEFVAVYDINVNNAELLASNPADVSDPAHNYIMTVETGVLEIVEPHAFYISSVGVEREFRSGDQTVPFDGFYLYHRTNTGQYIEVTEGDVYDELTEKIIANEWYGPGNTGPNAGTYNNRIRPVIPTNLGIDVARMAVADYQHTGVEGKVNEGSFIITPRKITILAEDKTSVFGENYKVYTYKVYDGQSEEGVVGLQESNVVLNQGTAYAANTIAYFGGLSCGIEDAVNAAEKPLTENVTAPIAIVERYNNDNQTTAQRNPNYSIKFINGTYTVTPSTEGYYVDIQWNKKFGDQDWTKTVTWKFGENKDSAEPVEQAPSVGINFSWTDDNEPTTPGTYRSGTDFAIVTEPENSNVIGGYPVTYEGTATITKADAIIIAVKTLGAEYPVPPTLSFDNKRVTVTGTTFAEVAAYGDFVLTYTKPDYGFIKNGAPVQVEFNGKSYGTAAGEEVDPEDWAWAANYESVTVKSGSVKVTAPDEITLDILAFNKASYDAANESADELIRDYDGTTVKKVYLVCSGQEYKLNGDQWYSMVLPFDTYPRYISQVLGGYAVVDVLDTEKGKATKGADIRFTTHTGELAANTPFIFKTDWDFTVPSEVAETTEAFEGDIEISYPVLGRVIGVDEDENDIEFAWPADQNGNQFIGTYTAAFGKNVDADNAFLDVEKNLLVALSGKIQPASNTGYLRPLGAYIQMANGYHAANARIFIEEADGTTTIINAVDADAEDAEFAEGWYTITGVKLTAEPTVSGTYIYNGKKVFFQAK